MAVTGRDPDGVALSYHDALLRHGDVDLLDGHYWLNDNVIAFAYEYMEREKYQGLTKDRVALVGPHVTQLIKMSDTDVARACAEPLKLETKDFIFFPVNSNETAEAGGDHWSLLVFVRKPKPAFKHFDSILSGPNHISAQSLAKTVGPLLVESKSEQRIPVSLEPCPCQNNGFDCGMHVIVNTDTLCKNIGRGGGEVVLSGGPQNAPLDVRRRELMRLIERLAVRNAEERHTSH